MLRATRSRPPLFFPLISKRWSLTASTKETSLSPAGWLVIPRIRLPMKPGVLVRDGSKHSRSLKFPSHRDGLYWGLLLVESTY